MTDVNRKTTMNTGNTNKPMDSRTGSEPVFFSHQIAQARRFFLRLNGPWPEGINVVCGGSEHCSKDYHIKRDDFPYIAVEFVAGGEGTLVVNNKEHPLMTGAIFAYGPGVSYDMRCNPEKPLTKFFADFAGPDVVKQLVHPGPKPGEIVQTSAPEHISEIFKHLIGAGRRDTPFRERICRAIGEYLLLRIAESSAPLGAISAIPYETYQRCRQWIEKNFRQAKSLEQIAIECRVDESYMCRLFKRYAHQSPWQFVQRLKMRMAAQRLQSRDARVSDVANEFGFSDPFQFSRTFRRVYGVSPRTFMRLPRQGE